MRAQPVRAALRERNVRLFLGAGAISALGSGMAQVALAFAVLRIGGAADLGYVLLAREVPTVVLLLVGGVWADRVSRKLLLVGGDLAMGAAQTVTALLFLTQHATVWSVALLQVVFGLASAFTRPAQAGLIAQAVSVEHLQEANALFDLAKSVARIAGPAVGALVVVAANPGWALAVDSATFVVSGLLRVRMRIVEGERAERRSMLVELREGWSEFVARTWCWVMVAGFGLFQLTLFPALLVLGPVVAKTELGGAGAWGAILAFQSAGSVAGGLLALRLRPARPLLWSELATLPTAGFIALLGAAAPVPVLCAAGFASAAGLTCSDVVWFTTFQRLVPEHLLSRLSSFDWFGSIALNPLGYLLVAPFAGRVGTAAALYTAAGINASVSVVIALVPSIRGTRAAPIAEAVPA